MIPRRKSILIALATVLVLAGGGWLVWRAAETHAIVTQHLPARPDVAEWPEEFPDRLSAADKQARGFCRALPGLRELSALYHANGFLAEAKASYAALEQLGAGEARWAHLHASILAGGGELEEAIPRFRRAVALAPDYLPARLRLGDALLKTNETEAARKTYTEVLTQRTDEPYALLGLARCAIADEDWENALDSLRRAIAANPDFAGGIILAATVHERLGHTTEAQSLRARVKSAEHVDVADPWADALTDHCYDPYRLSVAAALAIARNQPADAVKWLQRAIRLSDAPATYHRQLARLYVQLNDVAAAREHFERATTLEPSDSDAWVYLVDLLRNVGDRATAYEKVRAGLNHCPDSRALHFAHGQLLRHDGRLPQALAEFRHAKRLQPNEANAYIEIARIYFDLQQIDPAIAELKSVLTIQPDHPLTLTILARYAIDTGDQAAARTLLRRARSTSARPEDLSALAREFGAKFGGEP